MSHDTDRVEKAYTQLLSWCRERDFAGHDPFDALNSRLFQSTPLARSRNARLLWTQLVKRSPADLRNLSSVPTERNSKGIALFALAQLATHRRLRTSASEADARTLLADLISMRLEGYNGAAWGYNFDWQSRNFFAPRGTATIVPTAFAARALIEAAREFQDEQYLSTARSICARDLPFTAPADDQICFSYSPESDTQIFNASLLAGEVLAEVGALTGERRLLEMAEKTARYVVHHQREDGSWTYGTGPSQQWVDNFHTAYVLYSLSRIIKTSSVGDEFGEALRRGYEYWRKTFFLADGWPKYYHDDPYPADAHAGASAVVTFLELAELDPNSLQLAEDVARWTIQNLRDERGFFYYQKRRFYTVRKPFMRWTQSWMLYALARLLEMRCL
ncbi:MAG: hypothetical protein DMF69_12090 [Acidobacteria bacterium]|nr:MAG: hypothetical protein DMF69_12090 [Acidobacteriota bacterium]